MFNADQHNQIHHWSREYPFTTEKFYNMTFLYATDSPDTILLTDWRPTVSIYPNAQKVRYQICLVRKPEGIFNIRGS